MKRRYLLCVGIVTLAAGLCGATEKPGGTGPWDLKELYKTPTSQVAKTETVDEGGTKVQLSSLYYAGEPWLGKPTRVFAYYARPAEREGPKEKLPAMVLVHGGGGKAFPEWARLWAARGYAALAMDLAGHGPDGQRLSDGGPDQGDDTKFYRLKEGVKNAWPYQAVAAVIRGHSLLRSMPEVDRNRIGITGISWGGYLTSLVMSLDDRLKAAAPVYGCGYLHENSVWLPIFEKLPPDERQTWIENFDPSRYLPRCRIPQLWVNGTNDFAYPLDSYQKSYRATKGPKTLCITVKMPHGHPQGWAPREIGIFMDSLFKKGEKGLGGVSVPKIDGNRIHVVYDSPTAIAKAQLHWSTDLNLPWQKREWQSRNAEVKSLNEIEAALPEARPLVFFLTLTDTRGAVISTEHGTLEK